VVDAKSREENRDHRRDLCFDYTYFLISNQPSSPGCLEVLSLPDVWLRFEAETAASFSIIVEKAA
jgi:hypothetical protein